MSQNDGRFACEEEAQHGHDSRGPVRQEEVPHTGWQLSSKTKISPETGQSSILRGGLNELPVLDFLGYFSGRFYNSSSNKTKNSQKIGLKSGQKVSQKLKRVLNCHKGAGAAATDGGEGDQGSGCPIESHFWSWQHYHNLNEIHIYISKAISLVM